MSDLSIVPKLPDVKSSQGVIDVLEALLKSAKEGEIVGGAFCVYDRGRHVVNLVVPGENPTLLLGTIATMQYRLAKYIDI